MQNMERDNAIIRHHEQYGEFTLFPCFMKEIENIFFLVPIRYRNTRESLGEHRNSVKTLALRARVPATISRSHKLPLVFR